MRLQINRGVTETGGGPTRMRSTRFSQFGVALLSVTVATAVRLLFNPVLGTTVPFITFFPAVTISAWFGRLAGGLMTTVLAAPVAVYLFFGRPLTFREITSGDVFAVTVFSVECILISWIVEQLHRSRHRIIAGLTERKRHETRAALAAAIGDVVARSLDYAATVQELARTVVPGAGDFCIILHVSDQGAVRVVGVGHREETKVVWVRRLATLLEQASDIIRGSLIERAIQRREPQLVAGFTIAHAEAATTDGTILDAVRILDPTSLIVAPLVARGRSLGVVVLGRVAGRDAYSDSDLVMASELAGRLATAMDNARLYTEAMEANRLKDEFLATLSHELRTPLNAILGYAMMLRTGMLPAEGQGRALESIERNARHQAQLVEDILDVSRIVTGGVRLVVRPLVLASVIEEAVESVRPAADAKGVRLQIALDPRVGPVVGDADRLRQVVWNLLSNAVKFTPRDGRVQVRLAEVDSHLEIVVTDTGRGIPAHFLPQVFEPFRQLESPSSREHGGLGLGLAIARHLTELHGGSILVASAGSGQGSTFTVRLPLMIDRAAASTPEGRERPAADAAGSADELPDLAGVSVLLVDDDADAIQLARTVLEVAGAEVRAAASAAEALAMLDEALPHVLLFDIGLPGMDGYSLIAAVRERPPERGGGLPAAALTAFARSEDRARALRSGFQMHVAKPINPTELALVVHSLAARTPTSAPAAATGTVQSRHPDDTI